MDSNHQDSKTIETIQDDFSSVQKVTQSYLLLKKKICETHEVIKQYNDKLKECERLKTDLDAANKQIRKVTCNYNSTLAKVIKLELQNTEYKKNIETLTTEVNDYKIKAAADQQHVQQLICKVKDVEGQQNDKIMQYDLEKSSLQVKVKELEQELRNVKKSYDTKLKKMEKKIFVENNNSNINKVKTKDIGMNTTPLDEVKVKKLKTKEQCIMTDEFYSIKNDMYPIFCAKCEVLLEPAPLEKICKIMTDSCPQLIEKISSPPKKSPSPLRVSPNISNEQCKTENMIKLLETPLSHLEGRGNRADFMSTNILPSHTPIALNRTDYCNNFHETPNLMNPSTYYIGSTPINPLPLTNSSTTNQSNNCEDMGAVASSLSIISSLQKRIDTLELKIKKFNKRKSEPNSNCWQHMPPNPWYMYDINNSMQFNFVEMWKRMADLHNNKDTKRSNINKRRDNSLKCKSFRLKPKKRLQSAYNDSWKVESIAKKTEQSPLRKRPKKWKHRHSMQNNTEVLDKSISDSDTHSSNDVFNDSINTNVSVNANTESTKSTAHIKTSNALKAATHSPEFSDIDDADVEETIRTLAECCKSVGGETDSGILSDSVESSKLVQLEADACLGSMEGKNVTQMKSSTQNVLSVTETNLTNCESTEKSPTKVIRHVDLSKAGINLEHLRSDDHTEMVEDENELPQFNDLSLSIQTNRKYARKRKLCEIQELKKVCNRGGLLKKLRSLKKNCKVVTTSPSLSDHQEVQKCEYDNACISQEKKHLDNETTASNEDDYLPKKRPRIAHVPKSTVVEQKTTLNNVRQGNNLVKNIAYKMNSSNIPNNDTESNRNTVAEETKVTQQNSLRSTRSPSVVQETIKENTNKELQNKSNNRAEEAESNVVNIPNSKATNVTANSNTSVVSTVNTELSSEETPPSYPNICTTSNVNDPCEGMVELRELKIELNDQCENLNKEYENNFLGTVESIIKVGNNTNRNTNQSQVNKNSNFIESNNFGKESSRQFDSQPTRETNNYSRSTDISKTNFGQCDDSIRRIIKNEHSYDYKRSLIDSEEYLIKDQESNEKETNLETNEETTSSVKQSHSPLEKLQEYIVQNKCPSKNCKNPFKKFLRVRLITDKFVKKQLQRLIESNWETSVHWDVINNLKSVCPPRIIAKGIVDFLSTEEECDMVLDKSHTPPAPLMTKAHQRIAALLVDLEDPTTLQFVQTGIEYKLFKLNQTPQQSVIESLARMYTVLARIKKDREKVRMFCCDALYCLGLNAVIVLYVAFTCWPEVFPNHETNKELLPKCMAYLITTQQATDYPKLNALKNLVSIFYKYPMGTPQNGLLEELLMALQEKSHSNIEMAIILCAKREGPSWTYKNIIRGAILPMIINNKFPSTYRAFCLLGNLMRVFPVDDKDNSVGAIAEQLCDLINSGEGSDEQQEGVISALLSLSRHKFDEVVQNVIKWSPKRALRDRTSDQLHGIFNQRSIDYWKKYLNKHRLVPQSPKKNKT